MVTMIMLMISYESFGLRKKNSKNLEYDTLGQSHEYQSEDYELPTVNRIVSSAWKGGEICHFMSTYYEPSIVLGTLFSPHYNLVS